MVTEPELPVRSDLNNIAICQKIARGDLRTTSHKLAIDIRPIDRLSISNIDMIDGLLIDDDIDLAMVAGDRVSSSVVDCKGAFAVSCGVDKSTNVLTLRSCHGQS